MKKPCKDERTELTSSSFPAVPRKSEQISGLLSTLVTVEAYAPF
jgi:hypothetical protein